MNRRKFISSGAKLVAGAALGSLTPGCFFDDPVHQNSIWTYCEDTDRTGTYTGKYCTQLTNGITWMNYQQVIPVGASGLGWDSVTCMHPTVIKDGNTYKMWYCGGNGTAYKLLYCESTNGKNWYNFLSSMNPGASSSGFDTVLIIDVHVTKENNIYKMWYSGSSGAEHRIFYCESLDGINWYNFKLVLNLGSSGLGLDTGGVSAPTIIKDGSIYKMWYQSNDGTNWRILYCESSDGLNWSNFNLSVNIGASGTGLDTVHAAGPCVIKDNLTYKMWYNGASGGSPWRIFYCESIDGINWTNYNLSIDLNTSGTGKDTTDVASPVILNDYGTGKMWYPASNNSSSTWQILYAESF